jgi:hypothetical protein
MLELEREGIVSRMKRPQTCIRSKNRTLLRIIDANPSQIQLIAESIRIDISVPVNQDTSVLALRCNPKASHHAVRCKHVNENYVEIHWSRKARCPIRFR